MNLHEKLNYVEYPSKNIAATKQFFEAAFGWRFFERGFGWWLLQVGVDITY